MVFGVQKLQNDVFCLTEERDFFQGKYLEQISEIASLKDELRSARREIARLRGELMSNESKFSNVVVMKLSPKHKQQKLQLQGQVTTSTKDEDQCSTGSETCSNSSVSDHQEMRNENDNDDVNDDEKVVDIRQSAEKLLQWASYRSSAYRSKSPPISGTTVHSQESITVSSALDHEVEESDIGHSMERLRLGVDDEPDSIVY